MECIVHEMPRKDPTIFNEQGVLTPLLGVGAASGSWDSSVPTMNIDRRDGLGEEGHPSVWGLPDRSSKGPKQPINI